MAPGQLIKKIPIQTGTDERAYSIDVNLCSHRLSAQQHDFYFGGKVSVHHFWYDIIPAYPPAKHRQQKSAAPRFGTALFLQVSRLKRGSSSVAGFNVDVELVTASSYDAQLENNIDAGTGC